MEKYSQFRDRGSGIAPFFPIPIEPSGIRLPFHVFLFSFRLPLLAFFVASYFLLLQFLPIGSLGKKAALWLILGTPGIWWIDLQVDGVKRGSLASSSSSSSSKGKDTASSRRLPQPGSIIASSFTSPLDALYLAAIFDPVFTASYPSTRLVEPLSLFGAMVRAFAPPRIAPAPGTKLVDLPTLLEQNPARSVVVFPECTTTNGRGILPFAGSLLTAKPTTKIFPISLRYTAADITTPVPGSYTTFVWNLLSRPTHCIRVRIAESVYNSSSAAGVGERGDKGYNTNYFEALEDSELNGKVAMEGQDLDEAEKRLLDKTGEALARLGRVKRVGLGVREKENFVRAWTKGRKSTL